MAQRRINVMITLLSLRPVPFRSWPCGQDADIPQPGTGRTPNILTLVDAIGSLVYRLRIFQSLCGLWSRPALRLAGPAAISEHLCAFSAG